MEKSSIDQIATPKTIHRLDYRAPNFRVAHLNLDFDLEPQSTTVRARMDIERTAKGNAPLVLERSRTPGLFHLISNNEAPILDQAVDWAARRSASSAASATVATVSSTRL